MTTFGIIKPDKLFVVSSVTISLSRIFVTNCITLYTFPLVFGQLSKNGFLDSDEASAYTFALSLLKLFNHFICRHYHAALIASIAPFNLK